MKKILMTLVALVAATSFASAQNWTLGGQLHLGSIKPAGEDAESSTSYLIMPSAQYSFNENWAVGLALGIGSEGKDNTVWAVQPQLEYRAQIAGDFYYTPQLFVGYLSSKNKDQDANSTLSVGVNFGAFEYRPAEWIGITMNFGTIGYYSKNNDGGNGFGISANSSSIAGLFSAENFMPTFGVRFHF